MKILEYVTLRVSNGRWASGALYTLEVTAWKVYLFPGVGIQERKHSGVLFGERESGGEGMRESEPVEWGRVSRPKSSLPHWLSVGTLFWESTCEVSILTSGWLVIGFMPTCQIQRKSKISYGSEGGRDTSCNSRQRNWECGWYGALDSSWSLGSWENGMRRSRSWELRLRKTTTITKPKKLRNQPLSPFHYNYSL